MLITQSKNIFFDEKREKERIAFVAKSYPDLAPLLTEVTDLIIEGKLNEFFEKAMENTKKWNDILAASPELNKSEVGTNFVHLLAPELSNVVTNMVEHKQLEARGVPPENLAEIRWVYSIPK